MKKHLRIVKERTESKEVAVDLRGLGNEKVFKHFYPTTILTEKGTPTQEMIQDCQTLRIHHKFSERNQVTHYTCINQNLSHKEQAVHLFLLAIKHSKQKQSSQLHRFFLWETPTFRTLMQFALEGHPEKEIPSHDEFWTSSKHKHEHYFTLDPSSALHITQADFHLPSLSQDNVHLTVENCIHCFEQEIKKLSQSTEMNYQAKAGAK